MLARYQIVRGKTPVGYKLPSGVRQDTRKHTRHCLRPPAEVVTTYLANPTPAAWKKFKAEYLKTLAARYAEDSAPYDELSQLACEQDVYLGCSCPTKQNPDVQHCHTVLALGFMRKHYPRLQITLPD